MVLCQLSTLLAEGSLCLVCLHNTHLLTVFEPGLEEQPLSKCVFVPNSLLRCMSITHRADDRSPTKANFDVCVFWAAHTSKHRAKGWVWTIELWVSVSRNVARQKLCGSWEGRNRRILSWSSAKPVTMFTLNPYLLNFYCWRHFQHRSLLLVLAPLWCYADNIYTPHILGWLTNATCFDCLLGGSRKWSSELSGWKWCLFRIQTK